MHHLYIFFFTILAMLIGFVHLSLAIQSGQPATASAPWFFMGILSGYVGAVFAAQDRRVRALEDVVAQLRSHPK